MKQFAQRLRIDPYIVAMFAMIALAAILPAHGTGKVLLDHVVHLAIAILFFLYGARLSPLAIWAGIAHWRLQSLVFAMTFVAFPVLGVAIAWLARPYLDDGLVTGIVFICLLPSTVQSSITFTSIARGNVPAALCCASLSNLVGVIITPLLVSFVLHADTGGMAFGPIRDIALQILLPFIIGQCARPFVGAWLTRQKRLTTLFDRGSILLVVYSAFSAGVIAGIWRGLSPASLGLVLLIDLVLLAVVLLLTTGISRLLRFDVEDEIAIVFCGSKKSMASGIPMANILFPAHIVGLVVLPLMLFHQAQLMACAVLARRYARRPD